MYLWGEHLISSAEMRKDKIFVTVEPCNSSVEYQRGYDTGHQDGKQEAYREEEDKEGF